MKVLVTGGAGFIGSNLCEALLEKGDVVTCLDNFSTGHIENILPLMEKYPATFKLCVGDIRKLYDCQKSMEDVDCVLHEAALGSVPRSINDPITTNEVNISGFLNVLLAARDVGVKRFIYAASSSTYGDSKNLPKVESVIGKPLSPYAITKYVNELYADIFAKTYGMECIGLRYFNVFGRRQDPHGAYAAVIPLFVKKFMSHESPVINGDGGETKLETDRRRIRERMTRIRKELDALRRQRAYTRGRRSRQGLPLAALVGYTNAGKSTLLNALTRADVPAENKLFATLDPTTRRLRFPKERELVLADTVGFIRNLPKELVEAFRATLEELEAADLLLHVVDASHPELDAQLQAVDSILADLDLTGIPRVMLLNKCKINR